MELIGDLVISTAVVVANALYSVLAVVVAVRMPQLFRWMVATSVLAISCFALYEGLLILQSLRIGEMSMWITAPITTVAVLLAPPAVSNVVVKRLLRIGPSTWIVWAFSATAGTLVGMFLYVQLVWLEPNGV